LVQLPPESVDCWPVVPKTVWSVVVTDELRLNHAAKTPAYPLLTTTTNQYSVLGCKVIGLEVNAVTHPPEGEIGWLTFNIEPMTWLIFGEPESLPQIVYSSME